MHVLHIGHQVHVASALPTNQHKLLTQLLFAAHALGHKIKLNGLVVLVRCQIAVTVDIVKSLVVLVVAVFVVFLLL